MFRIFLILFSFLFFINSANATWVVKELKDNQISVYVKGEKNPDHKMMFLFRFENCYRVAEYFALNNSSSTEEVNVLVNGKELNLPITKSGKTSLGKEIIFLFNGYNRPYDFIRYYSLNDKINLKIKGDGNNVSQEFATKYISNFTKGSSLNDNVVITINQDMPINITYKFHHSSYIEYFLAPKIDDDNNENQSASN